MYDLDFADLLIDNIFATARGDAKVLELGLAKQDQAAKIDVLTLWTCSNESCL
jgi:hypothetical protein